MQNVRKLLFYRLKIKTGWDKLSIRDLEKIKPSFNVVFSGLQKSNEKVYMDYMKRFVSRLNREKLLGKNMRIVPYLKF